MREPTRRNDSRGIPTSPKGENCAPVIGLWSLRLLKPRSIIGEAYPSPPYEV